MVLSWEECGEKDSTMPTKHCRMWNIFTTIEQEIIKQVNKNLLENIKV